MICNALMLCIASILPSIVYTYEYNKTVVKEYYPAEFYATGFLLEGLKNKAGAPVLVAIGKCLLLGENDDINKLYRQFIVSQIDNFATKNAKTNYTLFGLIKNMGMENFLLRSVLMDVIRFANKKPQIIVKKTAVISDLNPIIESVINTALKLFDDHIQKVFKYTKTAQQEFISLDELPVYIDGKKKNHNRIPADVKSGRCLKTLKHIPKQDWDEWVDSNKKCIEEGMKASGQTSLKKYLKYLVKEYYPAEFYATGFFVEGIRNKAGVAVQGISVINTAIMLLDEDIQNVFKFTQMSKQEYISLDEIPVYIDGKKKNHNRIPADVKSGRCLKTLKHIPKQDWDEWVDSNRKCIEEGMKASGQTSLKQYLKYLRQKVVKYVGINPDKFDEMDVEHIKNKDYIIERYLRDIKLDEDMAATNILKALKFYKKEGFAQLNDSYFPSEFYATG
ncbi:unnamed protein product, partial [Medioppia subpectinata]